MFYPLTRVYTMDARSADQALRGRRGCAAVWISISAAYTWVAWSGDDHDRAWWGRVLTIPMALASCALAHVLSQRGLEGQGAFSSLVLSGVSALHLGLCEITGEIELATHVVTVATGCIFAGFYTAIWCVAPH